MDSMAEGSEGQVMVGSAMVAHPALEHNVGDPRSGTSNEVHGCGK